MRSWKTTLSGLIAGIMTVLDGTLHALSNGQTVDWNKVALGVLIAVLGYFSKDYNVSGPPSTGGKDSSTK